MRLAWLMVAEASATACAFEQSVEFARGAMCASAVMFEVGSCEDILIARCACQMWSGGGEKRVGAELAFELVWRGRVSS